jgi:hypothetical protein
MKTTRNRSPIHIAPFYMAFFLEFDDIPASPRGDGRGFPSGNPTSPGGS